MSYELHYHELVIKEDIPTLPKVARERIQHAIEDRLATEPDLYGKPLRRSLAGYRKLRVGDYRVVFRIERSIVKIFVIGHRSRVYGTTEKRMRK